jgi:hypothetical protein
MAHPALDHIRNTIQPTALGIPCSQSVRKVIIVNEEYEVIGSGRLEVDTPYPQLFPVPNDSSTYLQPFMMSASVGFTLSDHGSVESFHSPIKRRGVIYYKTTFVGNDHIARAETPDGHVIYVPIIKTDKRRDLFLRCTKFKHDLSHCEMTILSDGSEVDEPHVDTTKTITLKFSAPTQTIGFIVRAMTGYKWRIPFRDEMVILDVKRELERVSGIPVSEQRLIFETDGLIRQPDDDHLMPNPSSAEGGWLIINLVLRFSGGGDGRSHDSASGRVLDEMMEFFLSSPKIKHRLAAKVINSLRMKECDFCESQYRFQLRSFTSYDMRYHLCVGCVSHSTSYLEFKKRLQYR